MPSKPQEHVDIFPNPQTERDYTIRFDCPEFTCLCPLTGQPDFAHFKIEYVPAESCIELKSLKLYLWSFRDKGAFHEAVTNEILETLAQTCKPKRMTVLGDWWVRGGIRTEVECTYTAT